MSVSRAALALAGLLIGMAGLAQLVRKPVCVRRRKVQYGDLCPRLAEDEAAFAAGSDLELEAARFGGSLSGSEGRIGFGHTRSLAHDEAAAEWITVLTVGQRAGADHA